MLRFGRQVELEFMGRCMCSDRSFGTPPDKRNVLYTCPVCVDKALVMLHRLTSQLELAILDRPGSVSASIEGEGDNLGEIS